ncbi:MAG: DUF1835 domain-containing protein [Sporolactobacillus sp.]|nr:DUF1835 domain-containing protein [Sporolactobacillus sp.]
MAENLGEAVSCLSERASKRLLLNLLLAVRQAEKDPHEEKALIRKLRQMYRDVLATADRQPIAPELQHRWHLAFGDSAAGSLRVGLSDIGADSRRVCTFAPDLSVGPLMRLDEAGGAVARTAWLRQYRDGDDRAEAEPPFGECIEALRAIPGADSLMIWTADMLMTELRWRWRRICCAAARVRCG